MTDKTLAVWLKDVFITEVNPCIIAEWGECFSLTSPDSKLPGFIKRLEQEDFNGHHNWATLYSKVNDETHPPPRPVLGHWTPGAAAEALAGSRSVADAGAAA